MNRFTIPLCACLTLFGLGLLLVLEGGPDEAALGTDAPAQHERGSKHSRPAAGGEAGFIEARAVSDASRLELPTPKRERGSEELEAEAGAEARRQAQIDRHLVRLEQAAAKADAAGQVEQAKRLRERAQSLEELGLAG